MCTANEHSHSLLRGVRAFQEPLLSLDAPMRENYRPDLPYHANDGWLRPGSDGVLRLPPMTFEPVINMPQMNRHALPRVGQANAWLGAVSADLANNNWCAWNPRRRCRVARETRPI